MKYRSSASRGFGLLEILIAASILSLSAIALVSAFIFYVNTGVSNTERIQATYLLEEGLEAARFLRDQGYSSVLGELESDTTYYLATTSSGWIATTTQTAFTGPFSITLVLSDVYRDAASNDIVTGGATEETITVYSASGDGHIFGVAGHANKATSWNSAHDASSGTASSGGASFTVSTLQYFDFDFGMYFSEIQRGFIPFDTSAIPAEASISSAKLNVRVTNKANGDNDAQDYITVVETSQGTHTSLANADYNNAGAVNNPTEGVASWERKDITSISTGSYLPFTLNPAGISWIAKSGEASNCSSASGISCFGLREGHDATDRRISVGDVGNSVVFSSSEASGVSSDPYLEITYSIGGGGVYDPNTRKVTVNVSWEGRNPSATGSISASTYLSNLFDE